MKSVVYELTGPKALVKQEVWLDINQLNPDHVYAETQYSVVSTGTELAAWLGKPPLRPCVVYPRLLGYCNLAQVTKIGSGVTNVSVGDYILTHQSHRSAFIIPEQDILLRVTESDPDILKKITATYLYHLGYAALLAGHFKPGYQVAIVGMGTLGVTTASLVKVFGSDPWMYTNQDLSDLNLNHAQVCPKQDVDLIQMTQQIGMAGVDLVVNTSNQWSDHLLSLTLVRRGGAIVCLGFPGRGEPLPDFNPLDSQYLYDKQLSMVFCGYTTDVNVDPIDIRFTKKRNMRYLSDLISKSVLDPMTILSLESSWTDLDAVYCELSLQQKSMYSALLTWRE